MDEQKSKFKENELGVIPEEWKTSLLKNVCAPQNGIQTGPFGSQLHQKDYKSTGTPIITVEHLGENRIIHENMPYVSDDDKKRLSRYTLMVGDIVFSRVGSVDRRVLVREAEDGWLFSGRCLRVRPNPNLVDSEYLSWFFGLPAFKEHIRQIAVGATMPSLNTEILSNVTVVLPPLPEQCAIASILSSLDDKIALNRAMNSTLESIGQALFKHWFVDFEFPNEEGKPYKSSGGEMVETELGEVPKGWRIGTLKDICEITMGQSPPGETYNETGDGLPFYQGITDFGFRFPSRRVYCTAPTRFAQEGDILLSVRAPVGSLNVAEERCAIGRGVAALRLKRKQNSYLYYLLCATQSGWNKFEAEGTVFGSVNKSDVHEFKVIIPPEILQNKFGAVIESLDETVIINEKQSHTLAAIRDTLLPKLMSGEIRVRAVGSGNEGAQQTL